MQIALINYTDQGGGAEKVAVAALENYRKEGHDARLFVTIKQTLLPFVFELPKPVFPFSILHKCKIQNGKNSRYNVSLSQHFKNIGFLPEMIHLHNLHGGYFNLKELPKLSQKHKLVWTAHDSWPLTGHCAFQMDCKGLETGCKACPDHSRYPAIMNGATGKEFVIKRKSIERSDIHWQLVSQHQEEDFRKAFPHHQFSVVPNTIDLTIFKKGDKQLARQQLGISVDIKVVLLNGKYFPQNAYRDFEKVLTVLNFYKERKDVVFIFAGTANVKELTAFENVRQLEFVVNPETMALWYQAADVFFHPAKAESQGLSVMEALACGLTVLASNLSAYKDKPIEPLDSIFGL